jgi:hypothetical protein
MLATSSIMLSLRATPADHIHSAAGVPSSSTVSHAAETGALRIDFQKSCRKSACCWDESGNVLL